MPLLPNEARQLVTQAVFDAGRGCTVAEIMARLDGKMTLCSVNSVLARLVDDGVLQKPFYNQYVAYSPITLRERRSELVLGAVKAVCEKKGTCSANDLFDFFGYPNHGPAMSWLAWRGKKARSAVNCVLTRLCNAGKITRKARSQYVVG